MQTTAGMLGCVKSCTCPMSAFNAPLSPCALEVKGLVGGGGYEAGILVVRVVLSLSTPATGGALVVPHPAMLDFPYELVERVSWLIYARRRELRFP